MIKISNYCHIISLRVARKFIEKQTKVNEEDKETEAPDEHDMTLLDPNEIGKMGMKKSELKTTAQCLKKYEKHLKESMKSEQEALQETINDLGK